MADDRDIAILGASRLDKETLSALWSCAVPVANDVDDVDSIGDLDVFQALGVTSLPYPKDDDGYAEALVLRNVGGRNAVAVGARDTRSSAIVGKMKPGDTVLHSTGPEQAAQVQLKEEKRIAAVLTTDTDEVTIGIVLDGKNNKLQILARGACFEIDPDGDISLMAKGGAALLLQGSDCYINATLHLPGMLPGHVLVQTPVPSGTPNTAGAPIPLVPVGGVGK